MEERYVERENEKRERESVWGREEKGKGWVDWEKKGA